MRDSRKIPLSFVPAARRLGTILVASLVAGCHSSPPTRFYVLDAFPPDVPAAGGATTPRTTLQVATVRIPPSLDRQEMVRESGPSALTVSDANRWGAPLADMTQDVLTRDLATRLSGIQVLAPRAAVPSATRELSVDLLQFGVDSTGHVVLSGGWALYCPGSDSPRLTHDVNLSEPIHSEPYATQAQIMSRLLGRLADDIAGSLASARQGEGNCATQ